MRIHQKREVWYLSEPYKDIRAFSSEEEAKKAAGWLPPVEEAKIAPGAPTISAGARGYQSSLWFGVSEESLDGSTKEKEGN